jgi:hypothetical protein
MHTRSRRSHLPVLFLALFAAVLTLAACGSGNSTTTNAPSVAPSVAPPAAPSAAAPGAAESPGASAPPPGAAAGTQSDTEWGRIWDDVPPGFPTYPGSTVADDSSPEPVSATYAIAGGEGAEQIASWMQAALETATFSTEALSGPLEDGSFVLDSVGDGECRIQVVVAPLGGLTFVTVRYGAACPAA